MLKTKFETFPSGAEMRWNLFSNPGKLGSQSRGKSGVVGVPNLWKGKPHPISQMSPGKFCPGCGHQITNNQILNMWNQTVTARIFRLTPLLPIQGGELGRQGPRGRWGHRHGTHQPKLASLSLFNLQYPPAPVCHRVECTSTGRHGWEYIGGH